jgi:hypothetical protein
MNDEPASRKQIQYAEVICETLHLDMPINATVSEMRDFIQLYVRTFKAMTYDPETKTPYVASMLHEDALFFIKENKAFRGIYILWTGEKVAYIGKTVSNVQRIMSSVCERMKKRALTHLSIIPLSNEADIHIMEVLLITRYNPILNGSCVTEDDSVIFKDIDIDIHSLEKIMLLKPEFIKEYFHEE